MPSAAPSAAEADGSGARRRKRKKPAGSKWINRLLALGCCASLLPLIFEYHWTRQPEHMAKPHKDDPWVRVIDAAPPDQALGAKMGAGVQKLWRHHPRHGRHRANVRADGTMVDTDDEDETSEAWNGTSATGLSADDAAATAAVAAIAAGVTIPRAANATGGETLSTTAGEAVAAGEGAAAGGSRGAPATKGGANASAPISDDDELRNFFRAVDRANPSRANATDEPMSRGRTGASAGAHRTPTARSRGLCHCPPLRSRSRARSHRYVAHGAGRRA